MRPELRLLAVIGVLTLALADRGRAQISPGPLARPHQALEGGLQCLRCHPVGRKDAMDAACQDCHREIGWLKTERRGLHAREAGVRCSSCHPDHAGTDFRLVAWTADSITRFDHRRAGYLLDGAHREVKCEGCHRQSNRVGPAARMAPAGTEPIWWTGLETSCASCHEDVHQGGVEGACVDCHTTGAWAPAPRFDHTRTDYPLTGRHQKVACRQCHAVSADQVAAARGDLNPVFARLQFAECSGCHRDSHQGRLGSACADCHVTTGFAERPAGGFDHARTRYPLEGRHRSVGCAACHGTGNRRPNPAFTSCASCHRDAHDSAATVPSRVRDCAACHGLAGFTSSSFTPARHSQSRCQDCHVESHASQLGRIEGGDGCQSCHLVSEWTATAYLPARHGSFGLPLDGRHAEVTCGACHGPSRPDLPPLTGVDSLGPAGVRFRLGTSDCVSCHSDPHQGRLVGSCKDCHNASAFRPSTMDLVSHGTRAFPLEGAHRAVPCVACHDGLARPSAGAALLRATVQPAPLDLRTGPTGCAACHRDSHVGQFVAREGGRCDLCHSADRFAPAERFDHDRDAAFSLEGGHATVACSRCHPSSMEGGRLLVQYRPTPRNCESCHPARPPSPETRGPR
ncbi:MAG: cytochrome c3 family protein [Gemmatimonadota bacterium]